MREQIEAELVRRGWVRSDIWWIPPSRSGHKSVCHHFARAAQAEGLLPAGTSVGRTGRPPARKA